MRELGIGLRGRVSGIEMMRQRGKNASFEEKIRSLFGSSLIGYWPGDESDGAVIYDRSGKGHNGSYTNVSLGQPGFGDGKTVGSYNGASSQAILLSAGLTSDFNGNEGTLVCFGRMSSGSVWMDTVNRSLFQFAKSDYSQVFRVQKSNVLNNLTFGARGKDAVFSGFSTDKDFCVGVSWSTSNDRMIPFYQGRPRGNPVTGLTAWGASTLAKAYLGSATLSMNFHSGLIGHLFLLNREITNAEMYMVYTMMKPDHKNISIIGDSISALTYGWAYRVAEQYGNSQNALFNHAISGNSIMAHMDAQCSAAGSDNADIIIHQLGTNDNNAGDMSALQAKIESNIALLKITNPRARQYYLGVTPIWTDVGGGTPQDRSNIRSAQKAACISQSIPYIDSYAGSNILVTDTSDGVHLTEAGSEKLADWLRDEIRYLENGVIYLLRDSFGTPRVAGAVNGSNAEPGPGTRMVIDTENKLSTANGKLVFSSGKVVPSWGDPGIWYGGLGRIAGRTLKFSAKRPLTNDNNLGWDVNQNGGISGHSMLLFNNGPVDVVSGCRVYTSIPAGFSDFACILRETGCFWFLKENSNWVLLYVESSGANATLYPGFLSASSQDLQIDDASVFDLPSPWNSSYGIATQRLAGARAQNDTFIHEANCLVEYVVTTIPNPGEVAVVTIRRQDDDNCWNIGVQGDGSMYLNERVAGVNTTRGTAGVGVVSNGHRIVVVANEQTIKVYSNNVLRITYSSAANFSMLTNGNVRILGTGGAISDIISWPRVLSGAALAALNKV